MSGPRELDLSGYRQGNEGVQDCYDDLMAALDLASDQGQVTWVLYGGKRYAAIVPVDVAERDQQTVDEVYEHVRKVTESPAPREVTPEMLAIAVEAYAAWRQDHRQSVEGGGRNCLRAALAAAGLNRSRSALDAAQAAYRGGYHGKAGSMKLALEAVLKADRS